METMLRALGLAVLVLGLAACNTTSTLDVGMDTEGAGEDGPTLSTWNSSLTVSDAVFLKSNRASGAHVSGVEVVVTNTGTDVLAGAVAPCNLYVGVYNTPQRDGARVGVLGGKGCPEEGPVLFEITPGGSKVFTVPGDPVAEILGGRAAGTYYTTFWMELSDPDIRTREYVAGEVDLP